MSDDPREYDREWTERLGESVRRRVGYTTERGDVVRFVVQLEYELQPGDWRQVVRADHDSAGSDEATHDVEAEGVHLDVYREGEKVGTVQIAGPMPAGAAFTTAEEHLTEHAEGYINRFRAWHLTDR